MKEINIYYIIARLKNMIHEVEDTREYTYESVDPEDVHEFIAELERINNAEPKP